MHSKNGFPVKNDLKYFFSCKYRETEFSKNGNFQNYAYCKTCATWKKLIFLFGKKYGA